MSKHELLELEDEVLFASDRCCLASKNPFTTVFEIVEFLVPISVIPVSVDLRIVVFFTTTSEVAYISSPYLDSLMFRCERRLLAESRRLIPTFFEYITEVC